ncbi:MAG: DNA replication/repair protein RecF [Lentisphaerae bacterium]|nr:DNA replication/repair protein RecF [Lentisphaerota bacterium]
MLHHIRLTDFRNYSSCRVDLHSGMNCFTGRNGQGKTNLLEAVYYLSLLRSFRTSRLADLIAWKKNGFVLSGQARDSAGRPVDLAVSQGLERKLLINHSPVYRASDFINQFVCVTFIPQDLELVQGAAQLRRRFMDIAISQFSTGFLRHLQAYNNALKSRNAMLRNLDKYPRAMITAYDCQMIREGIAVELARKEFARDINQSLEEKSVSLLAKDRRLEVRYLSRLSNLLQCSDDDPDQIEAAYRQGLEKSFERDCRNGNTAIGPHRADLSCILDGNLLNRYGSQGECRIASLALRFACLDIIRRRRGDDDVTLIVDDVFGELDAFHRRQFFAELTRGSQVLLACTAIPPELGQPERLYNVSAGTISSPQEKHEEE